MVEIFQFFQQYEQVLYFILGLAGIYFGWNLYISIVDVRKAVFGLEQISAKRKFNQSAISLFIVFMMGYMVYAMVSFFVPWFSTDVDLPIDVELTQIANSDNPDGEIVSDTSLDENEIGITPSPLSDIEINQDGCVEGEIEINFPRPNTIVSGVISVEGLINVPNFGHYKVEISRVDVGLWHPLMASHNLVTETGTLTEWDTTKSIAGDWIIQLVVVNSDNTTLIPCRIPIRISGN
jgi:hypothetical protein